MYVECAVRNGINPVIISLSVENRISLCPWKESCLIKDIGDQDCSLMHSTKSMFGIKNYWKICTKKKKKKIFNIGDT